MTVDSVNRFDSSNRFDNNNNNRFDNNNNNININNSLNSNNIQVVNNNQFNFNTNDNTDGWSYFEGRVGNWIVDRGLSWDWKIVQSKMGKSDCYGT